MEKGKVDIKNGEITELDTHVENHFARHPEPEVLSQSPNTNGLA